MDLQPAEAATSRRSLLGALGVAGLTSAVAVAMAQPASASPAVPNATTESDRDLLGRLMQLELATSRLYRDAVESGLEGAALEVAQTFAANHVAYADKMAGISGISADTYNEVLYETRKDAFSTGDPVDFATAARELENSAVATYTDLFNDFESIDAQTLISSIVVVNGRMATVLASLATISNASELFEPDAEIIAIVEVEA